jgi:CRISPR-associated protein Cas1
VVTDGDESLLRLNLRRIRQVVCYGRIGLSTAFLHRATERGIDVVLLSEGGTLGGRLTAPATSDPSTRLAQFRAADDAVRSQAIAAEFVAGKINNMRVTLLRTAARTDDPDAAHAAQRLEQAGDDVDKARDINHLLGLEGAATRDYMQALRRMVGTEWGFVGRQRRPPPDLVNAMLSYGYTILCHESIAALEAARLDPMVGFLHQHRWGRPALALDLMEEFRPLTVDVAVWRCLSTRQLRPEQFTIEPDVGCRMGDDARHTFLAAYERRMLTLTTHHNAGRRVSYRIALSLQAKLLARSLFDPARPYVPLRWK